MRWVWFLVLSGCTAIGAGGAALATVAHNSNAVALPEPPEAATDAPPEPMFCARAPEGRACLCTPTAGECQTRVDDLVAHARPMNACTASSYDVCTGTPPPQYCADSRNGRIRICEASLALCTSHVAHLVELGGIFAPCTSDTPPAVAIDEPDTCTPSSAFFDVSAFTGIGLVRVATDSGGRVELGMLTNECAPRGKIAEQTRYGVAVAVASRREDQTRSYPGTYTVAAERNWAFAPDLRGGPRIALGMDDEEHRAFTAEAGGRLRFRGFWIGADAIYRTPSACSETESGCSTELSVIFSFGLSSEGGSATPWSKRGILVAAVVGLVLDCFAAAALSNMK